MLLCNASAGGAFAEFCDYFTEWAIARGPWLNFALSRKGRDTCRLAVVVSSGRGWPVDLLVAVTMRLGGVGGGIV